MDSLLSDPIILGLTVCIIIIFCLFSSSSISAIAAYIREEQQPSITPNPPTPPQCYGPSGCTGSSCTLPIGCKPIPPSPPKPPLCNGPTGCIGVQCNTPPGCSGSAPPAPPPGPAPVPWFTTSTGLDTQILDLTCSVGNINILSAIYSGVTGCTGISNNTARLQNLCDGQSNCSIGILPENYVGGGLSCGDPCFGLQKNLILNWGCTNGPGSLSIGSMGNPAVIGTCNANNQLVFSESLPAGTEEVPAGTVSTGVDGTVMDFNCNGGIINFSSAIYASNQGCSGSTDNTARLNSMCAGQSNCTVTVLPENYIGGSLLCPTTNCPEGTNSLNVKWNCSSGPQYLSTGTLPAASIKTFGTCVGGKLTLSGVPTEEETAKPPPSAIPTNNRFVSNPDTFDPNITVFQVAPTSNILINIIFLILLVVLGYFIYKSVTKS